MSPIAERPDLERVLQCAKHIASRVGDHGLTDRDLLDKIEEILFWRKHGWECLRLQIITREELANLVLAHLDTLVERACGRGFHTAETAAGDASAMCHALFGDADQRGR
ncbi:MAG TPA: hypothetical protein VFQ53_35895 [Kofleriaceae bacterium]|nr:hypothetical protein [Kofleriaceae bacterium]